MTKQKSEWDVHFKLSGFYQVTAHTKEEAEEIVTEIIKERILNVEDMMHCSLQDPCGEYVTDVILYQEESEYDEEVAQ